MSVYGHRCLGPKGLAHGCRGIMHYEYTEKMMYNQLLYFSSLFDIEKAKTTAKGTERGKPRLTSSEVPELTYLRTHTSTRRT